MRSSMACCSLALGQIQLQIIDGEGCLRPGSPAGSRQRSRVDFAGAGEGPMMTTMSPFHLQIDAVQYLIAVIGLGKPVNPGLPNRRGLLRGLPACAASGSFSIIAGILLGD